MMKSGFWRNLAARGLQSPYLVLLFVASVLLSIASFYTTYVGILPFVAHAIFGFFITAAIQSLLFVVSWRLGFMFADRESIAWVDVLVFLVCFTLSVFFTFSSLFNVIFVPERQQEASLGRVRDGASAALNQIDEKLKTRLQEQVQALGKTDQYRHWREALLKVADLAQDAGPAVRELLGGQREQQRLEYEKRAQEARATAALKGTLTERIATAQRDLSALQARQPPLLEGLPELAAQIDELDLKIAQKKSDLESENGGIGTTGRSGRGPVWQGLDKELKKLQAQKAAQQDQLRIKKQRVTDLDAQLAELGERLRKDQLQLRDSDSEILAANNRTNEAKERFESMGAAGGIELSVQQLREYPKKFETTADPAFLAQAEMLCNQLYDNMKNVAKLSAPLTELSCDRGLIMPLVSAIIETQKTLAALDLKCTGAQAPSLHEMAIDQVLTTARDCIDLSKLPYVETRGQRQDLDRLQREEGPHASELTKTTNALFAGEKLAVFALLIAIAMDLLVLFTGLIGAKSAGTTFTTRVLEPARGDDPEAFAIKTLLGKLESVNEKIGGVRYEGKIDLGSIRGERERELIGQLLRRNAASGMVLVSPDKPDLYWLRWGSLEQLYEQLQRSEQQRAVQTPVFTPGGRSGAGAGAPGGFGGLGPRSGPGQQRPGVSGSDRPGASRTTNFGFGQGGIRAQGPVVPAAATQRSGDQDAPTPPPATDRIVTRDSSTPPPAATAPTAAAPTVAPMVTEPWDLFADDLALEPAHSTGAKTAAEPPAIPPATAPHLVNPDDGDDAELVYQLLMETEPGKPDAHGRKT